jgi:ABC-2 type transport system ATP-binding protein
MSEVVLECKSLKKRINEKDVIKNISFNLYKGDILGFIGPNGAGKTTTIKLILGLYNIDSGSVKINNYDLKKDFVKAISGVGAIIENPDMYMYMSGYENLMISAKLYNIKKSRVNEVIKLVGLEKRIKDKVSKYSLGMRQRLGIAQAILHQPKLLILDEPTNGLDPEGIKDLKKLLKHLSTLGMGIIVSSHILSELESFCNKICIINNGQVINYLETKQIQKMLKTTNYLLELNNINIDKYLNDYKIIDERHIKISTDNQNLNKILKKLINNNIKIYEVKKEVLSLEDVFLQLVGGNTID